MPAATWLRPGRRGSGWTLGGAGPQQREGRRAIKSLIRGRWLPEGGRLASLTSYSVPSISSARVCPPSGPCKADTPYYSRRN